MFGDILWGGARWGDSPWIVQLVGIPSVSGVGVGSLEHATSVHLVGIPSVSDVGIGKFQYIIHGVGIGSVSNVGLWHTVFILNGVGIPQQSATGVGAVVKLPIYINLPSIVSLSDVGPGTISRLLKNLIGAITRNAGYKVGGTSKVGNAGTISRGSSFKALTVTKIEQEQSGTIKRMSDHLVGVAIP